ncbi:MULTISPECIES: PilZ domain-containing protein [unclassified Legionella]|uniref:PilZ domain-containing protein n=1 Tax=unclassified Legionella TaxID=2622702 RepID=UPI0010559BE4|nr:MULTISPECIES: PilZ domain-containing protein [unclassified Legionella]MDI9819504.1 PilZ domain-containing protein [Legionella sp. PL877]
MVKEAQTINCSFINNNALYLAYMPFLKGGGLFIRSHQYLEPGTPVSLNVNLINEAYKTEGVVAWVTPEGAQGNRPAGIGVQFTGSNSQDLCHKIESCLGSMLESNQVTDTM